MTGVTMPKSSAYTSVPETDAIRLMFAVPATMDCATSAVTSLPDWLTPSATTPWSPQQISAQRLLMQTSAVC